MRFASRLFAWGMLLCLIAGCIGCAGASCEYVDWQSTARIVKVTPSMQPKEAGGEGRLHFLVEFVLNVENAPENSIAQRRTTPFILTSGAGMLLSEGYVQRNGITVGAEFPANVSEATSGTCTPMNIRIEGLH